jgi:hypothetical protein
MSGAALTSNQSLSSEASGVFSFATVIFKKLSLYKANPEWVSGNTILGSENA